MYKQAVVVNLTPHSVVIKGTTEVVVPPSGMVARVETESEEVGRLWGEIPIVRTRFLDIKGLPAPQPGVLYIASTIVAQAAALQGRHDIVAPDTGPQSAVRGSDGQIMAVRRLQIF
jgi:hypothetical protein